jgi:hypothetical protein
MKETVVLIIVILCMLAVTWWISPYQEGKVYDCSLAEFHPDYPTEVKDECRKLMINTRKTYI